MNKQQHPLFSDEFLNSVAKEISQLNNEPELRHTESSKYQKHNWDKDKF